MSSKRQVYHLITARAARRSSRPARDRQQANRFKLRARSTAASIPPRRIRPAHPRGSGRHRGQARACARLHCRLSISPPERAFPRQIMMHAASRYCEAIRTAQNSGFIAKYLPERCTAAFAPPSRPSMTASRWPTTALLPRRQLYFTRTTDTIEGGEMRFARVCSVVSSTEKHMRCSRSSSLRRILAMPCDGPAAKRAAHSWTAI
ncbi:MAG: hypothetical protein ACLR4Z_17655 [Butyricicoccaceae bacterium]